MTVSQISQFTFHDFFRQFVKRDFCKPFKVVYSPFKIFFPNRNFDEFILQLPLCSVKRCIVSDVLPLCHIQLV